MSDHTRQNLGRTHGHTCSTLVGTPELAQPARALAPASGQVRRTPTPSAVLARAYKASPGAPHFTPRSPPPTRHPSLARELLSAHHCRQSFDHRGQPTPVTPKSRQRFG